MAHFITHLGTQESAIDKAPQWNTNILLFCEAALVTTTLAVLTLLWWRSAEAARVRKTKTSRDGSQILPSPVPVLPRWLGFLGGHTLLINISKVIRYNKSNKTYLVLLLLLLYIALLSASVLINTPRRHSSLLLLGMLNRPCMRVKNCPVYSRNSQKFSSKKKRGRFRPRMPSIKTT